MKVNKHNNKSRKRVGEGDPGDPVPVHIKMRRDRRAVFETQASKHPVHGSMSGVARALIEGWLSGDFKV